MSDNAGSELGGILVMLIVIGAVAFTMKSCDHEPPKPDASALSSRLDELSDKVDKMQGDVDEMKDKLHIY